MSIPELRKRGYPEYNDNWNSSWSGNSWVDDTTFLTLIVYGVSINESITKLFMAGVIPGLILSLLFMLYIVFWYFYFPNERPENEEIYWFKTNVF